MVTSSFCAIGQRVISLACLFNLRAAAACNRINTADIIDQLDNFLRRSPIDLFLLCLLLQFLIACFSCFQICQCFRILLLEDLLLRIRQCVIRCTGGFDGSLALKRDIFRQANILDCLICLLCGISICKFFLDLSALCNCGFELFGIC